MSWVPWASEDDSNLIHLALGFKYSDAKLGVQSRSRGEFSNGPVFADTGLIDADQLFTSDVEFAWRRGPFWISTELIDSEVETPTGETLNFGGHHVAATWIATGEMRAYNRHSGVFSPFPIAQSVDQGGWGTLELAARWSSLDLNDGPIDGGELDVFSVGANWWLRQSLYLAFDLRRVRNNRDGVTGWSTGALTRIVMILN